MKRPNREDIIKNYLDFYKHSPQSVKMRRFNLSYFFDKQGINGQEKFAYEGHPFEIDTAILLNYNKWLNEQDFTLQTKKNHWVILTSFLKYIEQYYYNHNIHYIIPNKLINWNGNHKQTSSNKNVIATPEEIAKILEHFKEMNFNYYIMTRMFVETGMRKGELINLKTNELNLNERYIHSFIGKTGEHWYFFSKGFVSWLRKYCDERKNIDTKSKYLFLSQNTKQKYSERAFNLMLQQVRDDLNIKKRITVHTFRKTLNTLRKTKLNTPREDRERLLGHKTSNVNIESYTVYDVQDHRKLYDKNFPYKNIQL